MPSIFSRSRTTTGTSSAPVSKKTGAFSKASAILKKVTSRRKVVNPMVVLTSIKELDGSIQTEVSMQKSELSVLRSEQTFNDSEVKCFVPEQTVDDFRTFVEYTSMNETKIDEETTKIEYPADDKEESHLSSESSKVEMDDESFVAAPTMVQLRPMSVRVEFPSEEPEPSMIECAETSMVHETAAAADIVAPALPIQVVEQAKEETKEEDVTVIAAVEFVFERVEVAASVAVSSPQKEASLVEDEECEEKPVAVAVPFSSASKLGQENLSVRNLRARFESGNKPVAPIAFVVSQASARKLIKFKSDETVALVAAPVEVVISAPIEVVAVISAPIKVVADVTPVEVVAVVVPVEAVVVVAAPIEVVTVVAPVEVVVIVAEITTPIEEPTQVIHEEPTVISAPQTTTSQVIITSHSEQDLMEAMLKIAAKPYKDQAIWFLNSFWTELFANNTQALVRVWNFAHKFAELDSSAGDKGCELDELKSHRVLEMLDEALTFTEMRTKFHGRAKHVSLCECLIFVFKMDWKEFVLAPQGSDMVVEQIKQAEGLMTKSSEAVATSQVNAKKAADDEQRASAAAQVASESKQRAGALESEATRRESQAIGAECTATGCAAEAAQACKDAAKAAQAAKAAEEETILCAEQSAQAENEAKGGEERATKAEAKSVADKSSAREAESEAFRREQALRDAETAAVDAENLLIEGQVRVHAALTKVKEEQAAFTKMLEDLKAQSENENLGLVARRTANHEREMILAKNPEPLARAMIAEEAVVRRHDKLLKAAARSRAASEISRADAESSRGKAVQARSDSENARTEAAVRRAAAEKKLEIAASARAESNLARERASESRAQAESSKAVSDCAFQAAESAKEAASKARFQAQEAKREAAKSLRAAEDDERLALQAMTSAEESRESADLAVTNALTAFEHARSFVERVRKQATAGQGGFWWASNEIENSKRFLPQRAIKKLTTAF